MVSFCINTNLYITNYNTFYTIYFQSDSFLLFLYYKLQERRKKKKEMRKKLEMRNEWEGTKKKPTVWKDHRL